MKTKKLHKKIDELLEAEYERGFENGYQGAIDEASIEESAYDQGHDIGVDLGVSMERKRTQAILDMQIQWSMESGKGSDAIKFKQIKELLTPIEVDYSEEAYQKDLEKDGF